MKGDRTPAGPTRAAKSAGRRRVPLALLAEYYTRSPGRASAQDLVRQRRRPSRFAAGRKGIVWLRPELVSRSRVPRLDGRRPAQGGILKRLREDKDPLEVGGRTADEP